jgi:hypothetical protein
MRLADDSHSGNIGFTTANIGLLVVASFCFAMFEQTIIGGFARMLGDRVVSMQIGWGPQIAHRNIPPALRVTWMAVPVSGASVIGTTRPQGQARRIAIARLGSTCLLIAISFLTLRIVGESWPALRHSISNRLAPDTMLFVAAVMTAFWGLLFSIDSFSAARLRLGHHLGVATATSMAMARCAFDEAGAIARKGLETFPNDQALEILLASSLSYRTSDEAAAIAHKYYRRTDLPPELRAVVCNLWAWSVYLHGRDDLREQADRASLEALSLWQDASIRDTRGHILL